MKITFSNTKLSEISTDIWEKSLMSAKKDEVIGIIHASIVGSPEYRIHVAQIPKKVSCHFHKINSEDYLIVSGEGILHWGKVTGGSSVEWEESISVKNMDSFTIPEGCAHQLENNGQKDLIILFGCPDSHLDIDRIILKNSPNLQKD